MTPRTAEAAIMTATAGRDEMGVAMITTDGMDVVGMGAIMMTTARSTGAGNAIASLRSIAALSAIATPGGHRADSM